MHNGNRRFNAPTHDPETFADRLTTAIAPVRALLDGLVVLREMGVDGADAVDSLLALPEIHRLRISWELWDMLVIGDGHDPDDLLADHLRLDLLDEFRVALWGHLPSVGTP